MRARAQAKTAAQALGFAHTQQIKVSTAVSELARNVYRYAGGGTLRIEALRGPKPAIVIHSEDNGPGIPNLQQILAGQYTSKTGMGLGILGCKRLMDEFEISSGAGRGTRVRACLYLR